MQRTLIYGRPEEEPEIEGEEADRLERVTATRITGRREERARGCRETDGEANSSG